jgi:DNA-directed RNA polymerase specialized sigma subunit
MREQLESQLADLESELEEYEQLRDGENFERDIESLTDLPAVLIQARIASRLTQKQLAEKLGIAEQQVQRDEATLYAGASFERLQAVAEAVGGELHAHVELAARRKRP